MLKIKWFLLVIVFSSFTGPLFSQEHSVARQWNELILEAIRNDYARPTVHARNLFHSSVIMYDVWALFDEHAATYLLGKTHNNYSSSFNKDLFNPNKHQDDLEEILSFAFYRFINHRYSKAPGYDETKHLADSLMISLGYNIEDNVVDYEYQTAPGLGNFIALDVIKFGLTDGANEQNSYSNEHYEPVNPPLDLSASGNSDISDPNRWQPLFFNTFIDQSGNVLPESVPAFLSPEWGSVFPFSIEDSDITKHRRDGNLYYVPFDPGTPPLLEDENDGYKWGFNLVAEWSSHLDPSDDVFIDISPNSIGNITHFPTTHREYKEFYLADGGDIGQGHPINPITQNAYESQIVRRGDYTRVLAEFWADGPDSETPPGHWFSIFNYVMDQPTFVKSFGKNQKILNELEFDVKAYFLLGGALHDSAIAAWGIKGWYDYIRPISAIRHLAHMGQSTDQSLTNYHPDGISLKDGLVEIVKSGDSDFPLLEDLGKIKLYSWKGHDFIDNTDTDIAGVGWILAENWWPYQRPSFVTPPFAGYVSGHSTFSRAAADVLTHITNSPFFPGGMGTFIAKKNEFLVFEEGPSEDIILQWASYRDASDQCSLSRIWGGIHPPADDIPGRKVGEIIARKSIRKAQFYFDGNQKNEVQTNEDFIIYPNPTTMGEFINVEAKNYYDILAISTINNQLLYQKKIEFPYLQQIKLNLSPGIYIVTLTGNSSHTSKKLIVSGDKY